MTYPADVHGTLQVTMRRPSTGAEQYTVTFEEYSADRLGNKPRTFGTVESLRRFLAIEIGLLDEAVEGLLSDLSKKSSSEIFDVVLFTEDLSRLGFD